MFVDLLGARAIGPEDGFFELGGHSLLATQLVSRVRALFGVDVSLRTFIESPTIRGLARAVAAARDESGDADPAVLPVVVPDPAAVAEPFPLTDVQQAYWIGRTGVFDIGNVGMHGYEEFEVTGLDLRGWRTRSGVLSSGTACSVRRAAHRRAADPHRGPRLRRRRPGRARATGDEAAQGAGGHPRRDVAPGVRPPSAGRCSSCAPPSWTVAGPGCTTASTA